MRLQRIVLGGLVLPAAIAAAAPANAQSPYKAIDVIPASVIVQAKTSTTPQVVGTTALILVLDPVDGAWYVQAVTLSEADGSQIGQATIIPYPPSPCHPPNPNNILYSMYFMPGQVIVLGDDMSMETVPVTVGADGTLVAGTPVCHPPSPNAPDLGPATALTEMPGTAFQDGMPRLFVGTQSGMIASFVMSVVAGDPVLEGSFALPDGMPITALHPISQMNGPVLGAASGDAIIGIINPATLPAVQFESTDPNLRPVLDFAVGSVGDNATVPLVYCDGMSTKLFHTTMSFDATGATPLLDDPPDWDFPTPLSAPPIQLALGSLLMLTADGQGVYFDPGFDVSTGLSGCLSNANDSLPAVCYQCPISLTGDVNLTGTLTSADIISMVDYVFKAGAPPQPCAEAGDVNCDSQLTSADIIVLVNYVFKAGAAPCDVCQLFPACP